jgi:hypothetical protein
MKDPIERLESGGICPDCTSYVGREEGLALLRFVRAVEKLSRKRGYCGECGSVVHSLDIKDALAKLRKELGDE